jgi:hypothetical protein
MIAWGDSLFVNNALEAVLKAGGAAFGGKPGTEGSDPRSRPP